MNALDDDDDEAERRPAHN